jgi:hypothetical protein
VEIEEIKAKIRTNQYVYTHHAEIERRFFAIQSKAEEPDSYIEMPEKAFT